MQYHFSSKCIHISIVMILISFILNSCATRHRFSTSGVVPAAEGSVKVKKDNNNNYTIDLDVKRLADSKRLSPSREMYIVWMETENNGIKNIGRLNSSSGFLSNTLKSSLRTVSAFKPTAFIITAENDSRLQYPAGEVVLRTNYF